MKNFSILLVFLLLLSSKIDAQRTDVYIVRHAEKEIVSVTDKDPNLSEIGKKRALKLFSLLKRNKFSAVYSTSYKRTRQTVELIAKENNLPIQEYSPKDNLKLVSEILNKYKGGKILIAGHSNTIIELSEAFDVNNPLKEISDDDYGNIFHIIIKNNKVKLKNTRY